MRDFGGTLTIFSSWNVPLTRGPPTVLLPSQNQWGSFTWGKDIIFTVYLRAEEMTHWEADLGQLSIHHLGSASLPPLWWGPCSDLLRLSTKQSSSDRPFSYPLCARIGLTGSRPFCSGIRGTLLYVFALVLQVKCFQWLQWIGPGLESWFWSGNGAWVGVFISSHLLLVEGCPGSVRSQAFLVCLWAGGGGGSAGHRRFQWSEKAPRPRAALLAGGLGQTCRKWWTQRAPWVWLSSHVVDKPTHLEKFGITHWCQRTCGFLLSGFFFIWQSRGKKVSAPD